jgi:hypothetical protein
MKSSVPFHGRERIDGAPFVGWDGVGVTAEEQLTTGLGALDRSQQVRTSLANIGDAWLDAAGSKVSTQLSSYGFFLSRYARMTRSPDQIHKKLDDSLVIAHLRFSSPCFLHRAHPFEVKRIRLVRDCLVLCAIRVNGCTF